MRRPRPSYLVLFPLLTLFLRPSQAQQPILIETTGGRIEATLPDEPMKLTREDLLDWVRSCANAVSHYYGRFPVPHLALQIRTHHGSGVRHGVTYPTGGGLIRISVGDLTEATDLKDDWVLTHEMIHLAFPSMADNHHWIEEGLSTYVEPVARAQVGNIPATEVWKEFIRDMSKGQPEDGDRGLDNTPTWGRTYWGGAMFCLLADVEIRERTKNRKGLQEALRAVVNSGGDITQDWKIEQALAIGDKATGTDVLRKLYERMRDQPATVDLKQLWQKLGVELTDDGAVRFDDKAPGAAIRQAIISSDVIASPKRHH